MLHGTDVGKIILLYAYIYIYIQIYIEKSEMGWTCDAYG